MQSRHCSASTDACATSASTSTCSSASKRRARSSKNGGPTTTPTDRTRASTGSHQPSSQHAPIRGKTGTDSPYERGQVGEQVTSSRRHHSVWSGREHLWSLPRRGDATVRFVREVGWANAMCYMLIGEHWSAEEAFRMGVAQNIAPTPDQAMQTEIEAAMRIAACGPLGIKATLASAHLAIESSEGEALSKLEAQYRALYRTEDF